MPTSKWLVGGSLYILESSSLSVLSITDFFLNEWPFYSTVSSSTNEQILNFNKVPLLQSANFSVPLVSFSLFSIFINLSTPGS